MCVPRVGEEEIAVEGRVGLATIRDRVEERKRGTDFILFYFFHF